MTRKTSLTLPLLFVFAALTLPVLIAHASGGRIEGKVTDPKGAAVVGAAVTVTDPVTNQTFTAVTDAQGKFSVAGLPPGTYAVTISATGFNESRHDSVTVAEGAAAKIDVKLEIAPVEAAVDVTVPSLKPNSDPGYQQLRVLGKIRQDFEGQFATVNNLLLERDAAGFLLRSGEIYFAPEVDGRTTAAVFFGDGELSLTPPTDAEKHSLALFTREPTLKESFTKLVLRFSDKTFEQIKSSAQVQMGTNGPQATRANAAFQENQSLLRKTLRRNMELRTLVDLYNTKRPGFFTAFIDGKRYSKLVFQYDPLGIPSVSPEEVLLSSYGETDGGDWVAFHRASEIASGTASSDEDHRLYDITHHQIDASIRGTKFTASDTVTFKVLDAGARVLPFRLFAPLRVSRVRDAKDRDLAFVQEKKDEDADFGIIWPEPLEAGKTYQVTVDYGGGDVLIDVGGGNFFVAGAARLTWYPNNEGTSFGDRATFDVSFGYPKGLVLIGTGSSSGPEKQDGNLNIARWSSGETALAVAGFNYGAFKKKELLDKESGYNIEFYANEEAVIRDGVGSMSTMGMANSMLADAQNSARIFNLYFGKLPFTRFALTQQPAGNFGQAWPTLVYMPFTAFMDSTQRYMATGGNARYANADFFQYVGPHEIAHQWWGHMVGWKSYRDQWMSEGFAEFSSSLYIQMALRDEGKYIDFWNEQRDRITQARPQTNGLKPYLVGPITQGRRLSSGKTRAAYQFLVYPKGAYILHMLRQMMKESSKGGDKNFIAMMQDFIQTHYNKDISTEDLKRAVEKHMSKGMDLAGNRKMDWFFDQWVYGTEMPSYQFDYKIGADGALTGTITQSGVSPKFMMPIPVYVDYGKGWVRLGSAAITGNTTIDLGTVPLPKGAKRAAICAMNDVLALSIKNNK